MQTGTGPWPTRNRAAQHEVSGWGAPPPVAAGEQAKSKASFTGITT